MNDQEVMPDPLHHCAASFVHESEEYRLSQRGSQSNTSTQRLKAKSTSPGIKRKLEEEEEAELPARKSQRTFTQHETYWIPDGNVLVQIKGVRFKLIRSRLASQSTWFNYLFDAHENGLLENPPEDFDYKDIEETLDSAEVVDGLDLFFLDVSQVCPSSEEFSALLTAMDNAISYMYEAPPFPILHQILVAANYFRCYIYAKQIQRAILTLFPDEPSKISAQSIPFIVEASKLGRIYSGLQGLLRCTYYHLAREPFKRQAGDPDFGGETIDSLAGSELVILLELQRQLASSWDGISAILRVQPYCVRDEKCAQRQPLSNSIKKTHLFDPIQGVNKILKQDWSSKGFCGSCTNDVISKLKKERKKIWDNVQTLITPPNVESD